ncbi:hypothetical protein [Acaryochloris sp. IP29b_bin.137]|uniref:hypothetical protein n=1 Tax=Acaryochloris sp. IP29b_bin.137 TaxID=2969217 RepID=UPI00262AFA59|nr:hypothetical protein [Acaryochloris sp. IP29b_bin.137]
MELELFTELTSQEQETINGGQQEAFASESQTEEANYRPIQIKPWYCFYTGCQE